MNKLRLSGMRIEDDDVTATLLGDYEEVDLSDNLITDRGALVIAAWLDTRTTRVTLNLCNNRIEDEGAVALYDTSCALQCDVNMKKNRVSERGVGQIIKTLLGSRSPNKPTRFALSENPGFGDVKTHIGFIVYGLTGYWMWESMDCKTKNN